MIISILYSVSPSSTVNYFYFFFLRIFYGGVGVGGGNNVKRHVCDVKNSRLEHDLPASVNSRFCHFMTILFS